MASSQFILCIDQGTTGTTAALLDQKGQLLRSVDQDFRQIFPRPGWVEHDPKDIWNSVRATVKRLLKLTGVRPNQIAGIGITNQRETTLVWDRRSHRPVHRAIVWQDRRTAAQCEHLRRSGHLALVQSRTGLVLDPYFSATKISWMLREFGLRKPAAQGKLAAGTIDSYLVWMLTSGREHITDVSNASRTLLLNIRTTDWDADLMRLFGVPEAVLPRVCDSSGLLAHTFGLDFLPDGIPIAGIAGDQQAALFGQACFEPGQAKCTFGTGSFILVNTGNELRRSKAGLLTTVAWRLKGHETEYALEGGAFVCGAAVQFLRDQLKLISTSAEVESLARTVKDCGGVEFVPALTGLGAPHWDPEARGLLCGLTRGTERGHIARATLEAMALQNAEILTAMQNDMKRPLSDLRVDGGASANGLLMQMQADFLGVNVTRPLMIESTVAGAGYLAGLGVGLYRDQAQIRRLWRRDKVYRTRMKSKERLGRMRLWALAVERARLRGEER